MKEIISHATSLSLHVKSRVVNGQSFFKTQHCGETLQRLSNPGELSLIFNLVSLLVTKMLFLQHSLKLCFLRNETNSKDKQACFSRPGGILTLNESRMLELLKGLGDPKFTQINRTRKLYTCVPRFICTCLCYTAVIHKKIMIRET